MSSSIVSTSSSLKVTALLIFLFGLASQKHAVTSFVGDRETFATTIVSCANRMTTKVIDADAPHSFDLSQNEWKIFEIFQEANTQCDCQVMCYDTKSRIDVYLTFDRRPRLKDEWNDWDCDATLPSNKQNCSAIAPEPDSTCRVAVHGDSLERPRSKCSITCNIDVPQDPCIANPSDPVCVCQANPTNPACYCPSNPSDPQCVCFLNPLSLECFCVSHPADPACI